MGSIEQIDIHQVKKMLDEGMVTLADIRTAETYGEGHIDQAILIDDDSLKDFISDTDKARPLICYCYHGFSSMQAAHYFSQEGFKTVYSMQGGFEAWRNEYPTINQDESNTGEDSK